MAGTYAAGQILTLEISLQIDDICLFDPVQAERNDLGRYR
jgi:hypothetical protein